MQLKKQNYKFINIKDKYNIMSYKTFIRDSLDFNNTYKVFMLLSLSGLKLNGGVWGGGGVHPLIKFQFTKLQ
jgi:hypothetical protein